MTDFMRSTKRCALWAGMGIGKSSATLFTIDWLRLLGEIGNEPILIIGPMRVARDTWPEEIAKWENFKDLNMVALTGCTPEKRRDRLKSRADIFTINYELAEWLVEHYQEKWPFRIVVADESDRLKGLREKKGGTDLSKTKKGASASRAFQLARVAHNLTDRWINLSGYPAPAGLGDLWGQTWFLDRGKRLGATWGEFQRRYFRRKWSGYGMELIPYAEPIIHRELKDICLTVDPKDYFDLKEPIRTKIEVDLPPAARKIYKTMERDLYAKIEELGVELNALNAAVAIQKCLQLANGAVYTEHPDWVPIHNAKLEALESVVHEAAGMPILVAYSFASDKTRILKAFSRAVDISTPSGLRAFKAGDARLGVAHPKSMGHGIDGLQQVTNIACFFGHDWKTGERIQFIERIGPMRQLQAGLDRAVHIYDIVARDTEDEHVMEVHAGNGTMVEVLLRAMKRGKHATS
jgi:SNF2 family DNA or RNA helicase